MATQTRLQIPISLDLKELLKKRIHALGFTSLNEAIRVYLSQLAHGGVTIAVTQLPVEIVDEETEKGIGESLDDYAHGRYITVNPFDKEALKKALNQ